MHQEVEALVKRLLADAVTNDSQAEIYERDSKVLQDRAAKKRDAARVWRRAAARLAEELDELQKPMVANEGDGNALTTADADPGF